YDFRRNNGIMLDGGVYYQWQKNSVNTIGLNYTGRTSLRPESIERFHSFIELEYLKARRFNIAGKVYFDFGVGVMLRSLLSSRYYTATSGSTMKDAAFRYGTLSLTFEPKMYVQPSAEIYYFESIRANKELLNFGDPGLRSIIDKYTLVNVSFGIGLIL